MICRFCGEKITWKNVAGAPFNNDVCFDCATKQIKKDGCCIMGIIQVAGNIKDEDAKTILSHPEDFDKQTIQNAKDRLR